MGRAASLPPHERRAAIMAATERLILAQGGDVSTRAIAEAAGIAEGTIFRVFETKEAILQAIFEDAFNADARAAELAQVDMTADLRDRMLEVVEILQRRTRRIMALFSALGFRKPQPMEGRGDMAPRDLGYAAVAAILKPDADRLRAPPAEVARLLQGLVLALTHPMQTDRPDIDAEQIVDLVLNGVALHPLRL